MDQRHHGKYKSATFNVTNYFVLFHLTVQNSQLSSSIRILLDDCAAHVPIAVKERQCLAFGLANHGNAQ